MEYKSKVQEAFQYLLKATNNGQTETTLGFKDYDELIARHIAGHNIEYEVFGEHQEYAAYKLLERNIALLTRHNIEPSLLPKIIRPTFSEVHYKKRICKIIDAEMFGVFFDYDPALVLDVKRILRSRYNPHYKRWEVPHIADSCYGLLYFAISHNFAISPSAYDLLMSEPESIPILKPIPAKLYNADRYIFQDGDKWRLGFKFNSEIVSEIKLLKSKRIFDPENKIWICDGSEQLLELCNRYNFEGRELLDEILHKVDRMIKESIENLNKPLPGPRSLTLRNHQIEAAIKCIERKKVILAHDMGTGKSLISLMAARILKEAYDATIIVVGPVSLRENWYREASEAGVDIEYYSWAKVPNPSTDNKSYILICDEAHAMQSLKSKRTQAALKLADKAIASWFLTGTPIKNGRPSNLYPLLKAVQHPLTDNKIFYEKHFCDAHRTEWTDWDISGATNLDELHEKTKDVILRKTKRECLDLPPLTRIYREAEVVLEVRDEYEMLLEELWINYNDRVSSGIITPNDALVALTHLRVAGSLAKKNTAADLANEVLEQGGQVIVSTQFLDSAYEIGHLLDCEVLTGETRPSSRQFMVDRFQEGKRRSIVITGGAGGVGLNLHAADTVILVDRPWTPGDADQIESRAHRSGVNHPVASIWLRYGTVDEKVDRILEEKSIAVSQVLDGQIKSIEATSSGDIAKRVLLEIFKEMKKS